MGFFFKPKLWNELTEGGRQWAKDVNQGNAAEQLALAAQAPDGAICIRYIFANFKFEKEDIQKAALAAVQAGREDHLETFLKNVKIRDFIKEEGYSSPSFLKRMLETAAEKQNIEVWNVIKAHCRVKTKTWLYSEYDAYDFLKIAASAGWQRAAEPLFGEMENTDGSFYGGVLEIYCTKTDGDLSFALGWADQFNRKDANLARALKLVAEAGDTGKAEILFNVGANPHADSGAALQAAVSQGHIGMIDAFIQHGTQLDIFGREILQNLEKDKSGTVAFVYFRRCVEEWERKPKQGPERYSLAAEDTLAERQVLPDGGSLTILFNFTLRQQMVLTDKANTVIDFDDINPKTILAAYRNFQGVGGVAPALDVFDKASPAKKCLGMSSDS